MKKYINIMLSMVMSAGLFSCSKDNPFDYEFSGDTGKLLKSSLAVSLDNTYGPRSLRNRNVRMALPSANDFGVDFIKEGQTEPTLSYPKYSEMPEIVTLPVGNYTAEAHYGNNSPAAWEDPYYAGTSEKFMIKVDEITDEISPIQCKLANVRVSVNFDPVLCAAMENDCKVTVKVGESGTLDFTLNTVDKSGYFAYVENSHTLVAVFTGTVEGYATMETKAYEDVNPGNHYSITFRLHDAGEEDPGFIVGKGDQDIVIVDAFVETDNMNEDIDPGDNILPDIMRPQEQEGEDPGDDPGKDEPDTSVEGFPVITAQAPIDMDKENELTDDLQIVLKVHSDEGIRDFKVKIDSNILTPDALSEVGLPPVMDLVNPDDDIAEALGENGFGFPIKEKVKNQKDVELSITSFVPMLLGVAAGSDVPYKYYHFILTVTDNKGNTTVKTLKLYNY